MATISLTMNACGGSSTSQKIFYGKTNLVTGTGLNGTGWTLYSGSAISASTVSVTLTALEDNVDYSVERYCNCPVAGDVGPERKDRLIKDVCGSFSLVVVGSTTVSYQLSLPASLNNSGTWVDKVLVELTNASGTSVLNTNTINRPFSSFLTSGNFSGLSADTAYKIRMKYSNATGTRTHECPSQDITTKTACSAPNVTLSNVGATSMTVNWTVSSSVPGDTYNIIRNGVTIASGLPISASPYTMTGLSNNTLYQIGVQRNCGATGTATGTSSAFTVNGPTITQTCFEVFNPDGPGELEEKSLHQCFTVGDNVAPGNRYTYTRYGYTVSYTAIPGDNKYDVAFQLALIANAVTEAEWRSGSAPPPEDLTYLIDPNVQALGPGHANGHIIGTTGNAAYPASVAAFVS